MTNNQHGQVPEALRLAEEITELMCSNEAAARKIAAAAAELRRLHAEYEAIRATHVQNPAEIEHVADDVSKNGAEVNTNVYAELPPRYYLAGGVEKTWDQQQMCVFADATHALRAQQPAPATQKLTEQICISDTNQSAACAVGNVGTTSDAQTTRSTHDAPATQQAGEVRRAELVPGVMHCAKCKFQLNRVTLCVSDGNAYAGNNKTEPCPNGCGPLWPVTWEQEAKNCWKALEEMHERLMAAAAPQPSPAAQSADSVPAVSDLPPLPAPDLRDVGTKPQEIKEFLKGYATEYARTAIAASARAADSVLEDAALWHWLAEYLVGARTDLDDEIVACETVNDLRKLVEAAIKQGTNHDL